MVGSLDHNPIGAPTRERANLDGGFGIQRDAQDVRRRIGGLIDLGQVLEDGIGCGDFFWGCVLATFLGK